MYFQLPLVSFLHKKDSREPSRFTSDFERWIKCEIIKKYQYSVKEHLVEFFSCLVEFILSFLISIFLCFSYQYIEHKRHQGLLRIWNHPVSRSYERNLFILKISYNVTEEENDANTLKDISDYTAITCLRLGEYKNRQKGKES